ncbi:MAG: LCP family protein [Oenococcus sp.]|uniref:LCP family protein n=1 Tax=Oenococcus TaxID=46254 RepID=UPI0021E79A59|nr:LCP family protein [Oenococcus kitaharae]MCV3296925.1 LCP family protein [Oenococcus kitaharae]
MHKIRSRIFIFIFIAALLLLGYHFLNLSQSFKKTSLGLTDKVQSAHNNKLLNSKKPFSILLLGTDTGDLNRTDKGRTDSMMLVTVNEQKRRTTLVSIPRDTMVAIPGLENTFPQKINSVYTFTNLKQTVSDVSHYLNVPINFVALVNMGGLIKMVDQVGGVQVKSPLNFSYNPYTAHDTGNDIYRFIKGSSTYYHSTDGTDWTEYQRMDGQAALAFTRMRYDDPLGDYGRTQRQRLVIQALLNKAKNPAVFLTSSFVNSLASNVKTNLVLNDFLLIAKNYANAKKHVQSYSIQGTSDWEDGVSFQVVSKTSQQVGTDKIRRALNIKPAVTGPALMGNSDSLIIPSNVAAILQR